MTALVFASVPTVPLPIVQPWHGLTVTWTGWDGTIWDLHDWRTGVELLREVQGWHLPAWEDQVDEYAGIDGQVYLGESRMLPRRVEWNVFVWTDDSSEEWLARDQAWWRSFHPARPGIWSVTTPGGQTRTLHCRLQSDGGYAYGLDPSEAGWAAYPVSLVADSPGWLGQPITREWEQVAGRPFLTPYFPPVFVSSAARLESATIPNPGDVAAPLIWTITAVEGNVSTTISVGGGVLELPVVPAGKTMVVDTRPAEQTIIVGTSEGGVFTAEDDLSGGGGIWDPRPVPAGTAIPIGFEMVGLGRVKAELQPLHWRAF